MDNNDNFILLSFGLKSNFCGNVHHFYTSAHDMSAPMLCLAASDMHCPVCGVQVQGKAQGFKVQLDRQKIIIPDEWMYSCKLCNLQRKPLTSKALYHARRLSCLLGPDNLREDLKQDFISFLKRSHYQTYHSHYMSLGEWRHGHKVPAILCTVLCDKDKSFLTNTQYYARGTWIEAYLGYLALEKRHDFYDIMQFMLWHLQLTWFYFFAGYYLIVFWVFFAVTSPYIFSWVCFVSDFPYMSDLLISQVPCSVVRWHWEWRAGPYGRFRDVFWWNRSFLVEEMWLDWPLNKFHQPWPWPHNKASVNMIKLMKLSLECCQDWKTQ